MRKLEDDDGRFTSIDPLWEKFPAWSPYQYGYNNPLTVTDPSGMQGEPVDDDPAVDPYWEGGGGGAGGGGGGSMRIGDFITRAWNAIFSTTRSTPGGAGAGPAATPNRSENPDLLPAASSKPTVIPENYPGSSRAGSRTVNAASNTPKGDLPRAPNGDYLPHPEAEGAHTTLGTRPSRSGGTYTQGATFDENGKFVGRTDVTDHGRPQNHPNPHFHPATSPNGVGPAQYIPTMGLGPGNAQ